MKDRGKMNCMEEGARKKSKNNFHKLLRSNSIFNRSSLKNDRYFLFPEAIVLKKITCN